MTTSPYNIRKQNSLNNLSTNYCLFYKIKSLIKLKGDVLNNKYVYIGIMLSLTLKLECCMLNCL
jgi:hypothetical protein